MPSSSEFDASRLAPWTPVQAVSPAAHKPGRVVAPSRSVRTPAAEVVGRRRHRQPVPARVEAQVPHDRRQRGEASGEVVHGADVQPHVVDAVLAHAGGHGRGHHVAGLQLVHEALAPVISQPGPFAAQGLAEQGSRPGGRSVQGGRVKLHELDVRDRHPGSQGHGHARRRSTGAGWS